MTETVSKKMERECVKIMFPCFWLHFLVEMLALCLPVLTSWMIGDMADALLNLDVKTISERLMIFLAALFANILCLPLSKLWENLLMTRRGFHYGNFIYSKYLRLPLKTAKSIDTATLVRRIDSDTTDYYFILMQKYTRPLTAAVYISVLGMAFIRKKFNILYIFATLILAALPVLRARLNSHKKADLKRERLKYEEQREGYEYSALSSRDFLSGFQIADRYVNRLHKIFLEYSEKTGHRQDRFDAMDAVFGFICTYGVPLGTISFGAVLIFLEKMGLGTLLAGYLMLPTITDFYRFIEGLILQNREEKVVKSRLGIFYSDVEKAGKSVNNIKEIHLKNVSFSYQDGGEDVITNKSMTLPLDKNTRIDGANGTGKSTLLGLISGVYQPDSGNITDENGMELCANDLRKAVSYAEQDGYVFEGTVGENLFCEEQFAAEILTALGFEKPLDCVVCEAGRNLSPGEKKKIILARALAKPSAALALDEPENHLDSKSREALRRILKNDPRAKIYVEHGEDAAKMIILFAFQ